MGEHSLEHSLMRGTSERRGSTVSPWFAISAVLALLVTACQPAAYAPVSGPQGGDAGSASPPRTLVLTDRQEPANLHGKIAGSGSQGFGKELFNADLAHYDATGTPQPYLAEKLPELHTPSWQVFPDGRMETIYALRPKLTWHDGRPLTADDFVFALRVYSNPQLSVFSSDPQKLVEEILAPDASTLVIRWRSLYPEAGELTASSLDVLPRHILEQPYLAVEQDQANRDLFLNHPFWTSDYVGAGPYRLARWARGIELEGVAFAGHALGRPKIDRIILRVIVDENTVLANVLSGDVQYATTLRFEDAQVLKRDWVPAGKGAIGYTPALFYHQVQFRPEFQKTPALLDLRVRQALVHAMDKMAIVDNLYAGDTTSADTFLNRQDRGYAEVDRAITKYPYDLRRAEQLLNEVGLAKDREGYFVNAAGTRLAPDYQVLQSAAYERTGQAITDIWSRAGIDVQYSVLPNSLVRDNEVRQSFPGIATPGISSSNPLLFLKNLSSSAIGTPANRWSGNNRGGWSNAEFDRLNQTFNATIERSERERIVADAMKLASVEVPAMPVFYDFYVRPVVASQLRGPSMSMSSLGTLFWNVYEWELR